MTIQSITELRASTPVPTLSTTDLFMVDQALRSVAATLAELRAFVRPGNATESENGLFTATEKIKLASVTNAATKNQTDAYLLSRSNHSGTQAISTVTGLSDALDSKLSGDVEFAISDVVGLSTALDAKMASDAGVSDVTGLTAALTAITDDIVGLSDALALTDTAVSGKLPAVNPAPTGAIKFPGYSLASLPDEVALEDYVIMVTDATGGRKLCYSDGSDWKVVGTNTVVS